MQLYKIANEIIDIQNSDMSQEDIADTLEAMDFEFEEKVEQTLSLIKNLKAEAEMFKAEAVKLSNTAKSKLETAEKLKDYIKGEMVRVEKKSLKTGVHSISVVKPKPRLDIVDGGKIPADWLDVKVTQTPRKKDILAALKDGEKIEGCELGQTESSLLIK